MEYRRFVAAPQEAVWALVSDADRWLDWNDFEFASAETTPSGSLRARARATGLNGSTRVKPPFVLSEYAVQITDPPRMIQWTRSFPDADRAPVQHLTIRLESHETGTEITLSFSADRASGERRGLSSWALRPIARLLQPAVVRAHLRGKADNVSRALRKS